jgi:hypothetical protein
MIGLEGALHAHVFENVALYGSFALFVLLIVCGSVFKSLYAVNVLGVLGIALALLAGMHWAFDKQSYNAVVYVAFLFSYIIAMNSFTRHLRGASEQEAEAE